MAWRCTTPIRTSTVLRPAGVRREFSNTVLQRGRPTVRAFRKLPFLLPLNFQCTLVEPSVSICRKSAEGEGGDVLNLCYGAGFPPSDLSDCGPGVVAHGYSAEAAIEAADDLNNDVLDLEP